LLWRGGAEAFCFSAEDPESLRGPQFDAAWADEMCFWSYPEETLQTLAHGLRLGERPRLMATTTPRPSRALKALLARPDTVTTLGATWENRHNLAADFIDAVNQRWTGSVRDRRELLGELIEDAEGALWKRSDIDAARVHDFGALERIVVAIDPPAGMGPSAASCGIVAAGAYGSPRRAIVLADASAQGLAPHQWAARAVELARSVGAHAIVAEGNNGGEMVRSVLRAAAHDIPVRLVRASEGKRARAEPIAALYAQGRVQHAGAFPALEDEMVSFGADGFSASPDRLDALVWALTDLMLGAPTAPRIRML
jgi:phage terminase large subunit-like protein